MKKFLLPLFASVMSLNAYSQTETISFEASEGYSLGNINGQGSWVRSANLAPNVGNIVNTSASHGTNSMSFAGLNNNYSVAAGVKATVAGYDKTEFSFDYKIDGTNASSYVITAMDAEDRPIGRLSIDSVTGVLQLHTYSGNDTTWPLNTSFIFTPNVWYNLKMVIDRDQFPESVKYYLNDAFIGGALSNAMSWTPLSSIEFAYDDRGTGFMVDNIKITNADGTLGTSDLSLQNSLTISPNPASDLINIKTNEKISSVEILDLSGRIVLKNKGDHQVNVNKLEKGIYMVKINTSKGLVTKRMIKK